MENEFCENRLCRKLYCLQFRGKKHSILLLVFFSPNVMFEYLRVFRAFKSTTVS